MSIAIQPLGRRLAPDLEVPHVMRVDEAVASGVPEIDSRREGRDAGLLAVASLTMPGWATRSAGTGGEG
jgi:hypothetical protein